MKKNKEITYKYDLMHLNTPKFASSVITWDCAKMGEITKNRVISALQTGAIKYRSGDAASMYEALRKRFEIPEYVVKLEKRRNGDEWHGQLYWDHADEGLLNALNTVYQSERVMVKLENSQRGKTWMPYYLTAEKLDTRHGSFYVENHHDLSEVYVNVNRLMSSPELLERRRQAIEFVENGGKFTFTYRGEPNEN